MNRINILFLQMITLSLPTVALADNLYSASPVGDNTPVKLRLSDAQFGSNANLNADDDLHSVDSANSNEKHDADGDLNSASKPSAESKSRILQGGLRLREQLTPVSPTLRAGSSFYQSMLAEESGDDDEWIKIPSWRAGIFERQTTARKTRAAANKKHTFQSKYVTPPQVLQKDRVGGIWQYLTPPENQAIDMGKYIQYSKVVENTVIESSEKDEVMRAKFVSVKVDKATGKIVEVFQQEQIDYFTPLPNGKGYHQLSYIKWFDNQGQPQDKPTDEMSADLLSIRPFDVVDIFQGKDMRASLKIFLGRNNLGNLVPEE